MKRARLVVTVLGVVVSAALLFVAVRGADLPEVGRAVGDANPLLLLAAVGMIGLVYGIQGERWRRIAGVAGLDRAWFTRNVVCSVAVNNVVPGRAGDFMRARWLSVDGRSPGGRAMATVVVDRGFDVLGLVVLLAVGLTVVADEAWLRWMALGGAALLLATVAVVVFAHVYTRVRDRSRVLHRGLVRRLLRDVLEGLAEPMKLSRAASLAALSLAAWSVWAAAAWLVARAVGVDLGPLEAAFVTGALNLGVAIPSSPGFVGTYQWLAVAALALLGVPHEPALAFGVLMHATWYLPTTIVGGGLLGRRAVSGLGSPSSRARHVESGRT